MSRDRADLIELAERLGKALVWLGVVFLALAVFGCGGIVGMRLL